MKLGKVVGLIKTVGIVCVALLLFAVGYWQYTLVEVRNKVTAGKITTVLTDPTKTQNALYMAATYEFVVARIPVKARYIAQS